MKCQISPNIGILDCCASVPSDFVSLHTNMGKEPRDAQLPVDCQRMESIKLLSSKLEDLIIIR